MYRSLIRTINRHVRRNLVWRIAVTLFVTILAIDAYGQLDTRRFRQWTIDDGLSQNMINAICQDHRGYMWFGTKDGLNRYDGYDFHVYQVDPQDSTTISDNHITAIYEDDNHNLWVGTMNGGLNWYDAEQDAFVRVDLQQLHPEAKFVSAITGNSRFGIWVSFFNGYIVGIDAPQAHTGGPIAIHHPRVIRTDQEPGNPVSGVVFLDTAGLLWANGERGLVCYDVNTGQNRNVLKDYSTYRVTITPGGDRGQPQPDHDLSPINTDIQAIVQDSNQDLWFSSTKGIYYLDRRGRTFTCYDFDGGSIALAVVQERNQPSRLWASTSKFGLLTIRIDNHEIASYPYRDFTDQGLKNGWINHIFQGSEGAVWMGTNGRGMLGYPPNQAIFQNALPQALRERHASIYSLLAGRLPQSGKPFVLYSTLENMVRVEMDELGNIERTRVYPEFVSRSIVQDKLGRVWLSNEQGVMRYDLNTGNMELVADGVTATTMGVYVDDGGVIWYTTPTLLVSVDPTSGETNQFLFFPELKESHAPLGQLQFTTIQPDVDDTFWVGTTNGLFHFDPNKAQFIGRYQHDESDPESISSNEVKCVLVDPSQPDSILWIGTPMGLNRFDKRRQVFVRLTVADGLPNNTVYGILPDNDGNLWVSTNQGLSVFNPDQYAFTNFDVTNGLQSNEFNTGAFFKTADGELFFGGINGFNRFRPEHIQLADEQVPVVITKLALLGIGKQQTLSAYRPNVLSHHENTVSITLASLEYNSPEKIRYAYRIVNQDTNWTQLSNNRVVTLTNLSPGRYVFEAKSTDSFGRWGDNTAELVLVVRPPWWASVWAWMAYGILVVGAMYVMWWRYRRRMEFKHELENERHQAAAALEMDRMKSRFLTNITHEFRTPLTLISGHVQRLKARSADPNLSGPYDEIERHGKHLLQLINQLMDLSRLESGAYTLVYAYHDLIADWKASVSAFASFAEQQDIALYVHIHPDTERYLGQYRPAYARDALVTIVNNLLSNACKFTARCGSVTATLRFDSDMRAICFQVADTGPGIAPAHLPRVFDRFFQTDESPSSQFEGSGVGLALVKELAELHGGSVTVKSDTSGTVFFVRLKEGEPNAIAGIEEEDPGYAAHPASRGARETPATQEAGDMPLVLVVEDNDDLRRFIGESLAGQYKVIEGQDGEEGLQLASKHIPDLVVSDVMMPGIDGFELCARLKRQEATSHIPVVLLTARVGQQDRMQGLENGADDYLAKPFSEQELLVRVDNLIRNRKHLQRKYATALVVHPEALHADSVDDAFLLKLANELSTHMREVDYGVEHLAAAANLSTSQLNRKLKALTGDTAQRFIRRMRMQRALDLLQQRAADNVADVAYQVGFDDPGYFTKVFKKHFGFLPSDSGQAE